jgi:hypothetical protein
MRPAFFIFIYVFTRADPRHFEISDNLLVNAVRKYTSCSSPLLEDHLLFPVRNWLRIISRLYLKAIPSFPILRRSIRCDWLPHIIHDISLSGKNVSKLVTE